MKKKVERARRNRHTGRVNSMKAHIRKMGADIRMGSRVYRAARVNGRGITLVRDYSSEREV